MKFRGAFLGALLGISVVGASSLFLVLRSQDHGGPRHFDVAIPGQIPATVYLPDSREPLPVVVLGHGYGADRVGMSSLARRLASAGYGVVAFDFRGHGANPNSFDGDLTDDLDAVTDWVGESGRFDPDRIVVAGHSMGAHAALRFAAADDRPDGVIAISGATARPTQVADILLLVVAQYDPGSIAEGASRFVNELPGARLVEIEGHDHISVLWSDDLVHETVVTLDVAFDMERDEPATSDPGSGHCFSTSCASRS